MSENACGSQPKIINNFALSSQSHKTPVHILIALSVACSSFLMHLNAYMVNVSLPTIARSFGVSSSDASQVITAYILVTTTMLLLFGKLGDRIGLKRVFIAGYTVFMLGSLGCGVSRNFMMLLGGRIIQGAGASMLLSVSFALISRFLPSEKTGWAFGITSTASALGVATGAPVGGIITGYLSWNWIFFVNVPVCIAALIAGTRYIPGNKHEGHVQPKKERFDIAGAVLSFAGLGLLVWGINGLNREGFSPVIFGCLALAAALIAILVWWEMQHENPLLDMRLFSRPRYTFTLVATFFAYMLIAGNGFLLPFYLNIVREFTPERIGITLIIYSVIYVALSPVAGRLADRVNPALLCSLGTFSATACVLTFSFSLYSNGLAALYLYIIWLALSFVFFFSPNSKQVMAWAPTGKQGVSSGLFSTTINLGTILGVTFLEAIFSSSMSGGSDPVGKLTAASAMPGFHYAYLAGGLCCFIAFIFSLLGRKRRT